MVYRRLPSLRLPLLLPLLLPLILLTSCAPFAPEYTATLPMDMPANYQESTAMPEQSSQSTAEKALGLWWTHFERADLDALEEKALNANFDLAIAWKRLDQAAATARKSTASLLPSLSYSGSANRSYSQSQKTENSPTLRGETESYGLGLSASFEIDLWGRLRALRDSDRENFQASWEDIQTSLLTITGSVAETWVDVLSTRAELAVLEKQTELARAMLQIQQVRFANGQATALDLLQQQEQCLRTESEKPLLEMQEKNLLDTLSVLLGSLPGDVPAVVGAQLPDVGAVPALGLPADLLLNRPDIRAAAHRLNASDRSLAAAKATLLPSLNLSASGNFSAGSLDLLFNNWALNLMAGLTGPLFDGGSRSSEVARQRAVAEERVLTYTKTVATALKEVEAALRTEKARQDYLARQREQLYYAKIAEGEAQQRYFNGQLTFNVYITEVQSVQSLERSIVTQQSLVLKQRIALYRALGGDWMAALAGASIGAAAPYPARGE